MRPNVSHQMQATQDIHNLLNNMWITYPQSYPHCGQLKLSTSGRRVVPTKKDKKGQVIHKIRVNPTMSKTHEKGPRTADNFFWHPYPRLPETRPEMGPFKRFPHFGA